MTESFYDLLGVAPDADDEAIRRAYRERLKETHPDVSDASDADARTRRLLEAKETLLDPVERRRYDRVGHAAYVGDDAPIDGDGSSAAQRAAKGTESAEDGGVGGSSGPTNARAGPRERRARERRARERVDADDADVDGAAGGGGTGRRDERRSRGGAHGRSSATGHASTGWATNMSDPRADPTVDPTARRRQPQSPWRTLRRSPATAAATFGLYPLLVAGAVFPAFPLSVNVVVAVCVLLLIAALQSTPAIGVFVFAAWSLVGSFALAVAGVHPFSLLGLLVLGSTWFPLGLTVLTFWALRL